MTIRELARLETLKEYAEQNQYTLAAVYGISPNDTHYYYVRTTLPERAEIVDRIRAIDYYWFGNGQLSANYALTDPIERKPQE